MTPLLPAIAVFLSGVLAGEEFIVRWGVQPALTALDDRAHLQARIALVRRLRIVVPAIMVPTVLASLAALIGGGATAGFGFRIAGTAALVAFVLISFLGTVPINIRVIDWNADAPPADWRDTVARWQRIDVIRSSAALLTFALFVLAQAAAA
jgi:uncharacterized membrane protein